MIFQIRSIRGWRQAFTGGVLGFAVISTLTLGYVRESLSGETADSDKAQLGALMKSLSDNVDPQTLLDPELRSEERDKQLRLLLQPHTLTLIPNESITVSGDTAAVDARVRFQAAHSQLEQNARVSFVRRKGRWYFADFSFLQTSWVFIIGFVGGMLIAIGYASGVLWAFFLRRKRGPLKPVDFIRIYNPFTWRKIGDRKL